METNRLWKPDTAAKSAINRGVKKEIIGRLRSAGLLTQVDCKYCYKPIYLTPTRRGVKMLTLLGSEHRCKNSPRGLFLAKRAKPSTGKIDESVSTESE